jgi:hypothetical protein
MPRYSFITPDGGLTTIIAPTWNRAVQDYNTRFQTNLPLDDEGAPPAPMVVGEPSAQAPGPGSIANPDVLNAVVGVLEKQQRPQPYKQGADPSLAATVTGVLQRQQQERQLSRQRRIRR